MADSRKRHNSNRKILLSSISFIIAGTISLFSLLSFVDQIPESANSNHDQTDAIVVLTGGSNRLDEGLNLLARRKAKKLFVSGVYRGIDVRRLLSLSRRSPSDLVCCIEIGHNATSTEGNAEETKLWMDREGFQSLRLVTSNYHMPRSIREFRHYMPNIRHIPHAVFPAHFKRQDWWRWPGTASLILTEYAKYLMSFFRQKWNVVAMHTAH